MDVNAYNANTDIAEQKYSGPSTTVAGLGEGVKAHFIWGIIALGAVSIPAAIFPKWSGNTLEAIRKGARGLLQPEMANKFSFDGFKNVVGEYTLAVFGRGKTESATLNAFHNVAPVDQKKAKYWLGEHENGLGIWMLNHTVGLVPGIKHVLYKWNENERFRNAISLGSLFGAVGYFGSPILFFDEGKKKARAGQDQLKTAQSEILELRARNSYLNEQNADLETKNVELRKTIIENQENPKLHVSKDEPTVQGTENQEAADQQVLRESPGSVEEPKIKEPKIEAPTPAAPPVKQAAKVDHKDQAWSQRVHDKADTQQEAALA